MPQEPQTSFNEYILTDEAIKRGCAPNSVDNGYCLLCEKFGPPTLVSVLKHRSAGPSAFKLSYDWKNSDPRD